VDLNAFITVLKDQHAADRRKVGAAAAVLDLARRYQEAG
jgi:hypothetical protein